jgi:hypothetical protein
MVKETLAGLKTQLAEKQKEIDELKDKVIEILPDKPTCDQCGNELAIGDDVYEIDGKFIHGDCLSDWAEGQGEYHEVTYEWLIDNSDN